MNERTITQTILKIQKYRDGFKVEYLYKVVYMVIRDVRCKHNQYTALEILKLGKCPLFYPEMWGEFVHETTIQLIYNKLKRENKLKDSLTLSLALLTNHEQADIMEIILKEYNAEKN